MLVLLVLGSCVDSQVREVIFCKVALLNLGCDEGRVISLTLLNPIILKHHVLLFVGLVVVARWHVVGQIVLALLLSILFF